MSQVSIWLVWTPGNVMTRSGFVSCFQVVICVKRSEVGSSTHSPGGYALVTGESLDPQLTSFQVTCQQLDREGHNAVWARHIRQDKPVNEMQCEGNPLPACEESGTVRVLTETPGKATS